MRIKLSIILIFILVFSTTLFSQRWNQRKYEFYYGVGLSNFMGDIAAPSSSSKLVWIKFPNTIGYVANSGIKYKYTDRSYLRGSLFLGQLYAKDVADNPKFYYRGYKMSSFFTELAIKYEFHFIKEKRKSNIYRQLGESKFRNFTLPSYFFIGLGGIFNTGSLKQSLGTDYTSEKFNNIALTFPFGLGIKIRSSKNTYINIEAGLRIAMGDGLDNAKGEEYPKQFGKYPDQYQFVTINVIHKLRSNKKGLPKFKKR